MKGETIEVIKIADIIRDISGKDKQTVMIISDGDSKIKFYTSLFIKEKSNNYNILKTTGGIVGQPFLKERGKVIIGVCDDNPKVGKIFTINDHSWHTSKVVDIIENCVLVTMNSVYVIHNDSNLRNLKLNKII
jgi:hypothetical protein